MTSMIRVKNVTKSYSRGGETLKVLNGLNLEMDEGRFYALMGPSGSGKTTLLNLVGGLDHPDSGDLFVAGANLSDLDGAELGRYLLLPRGTTIDTSVMDQWVFPVGTKSWIEFRVGGKLVETRFLWKQGAEQGVTGPPR